MAMIVERPKMTSSAVAPLLDALPHSIARVAPENVDKLRQEVDSITLVILEDPKFVCETCLDSKRVKISLRALEILWCFAYSAWVFYTRHAAGKPSTAELREISDSDTRTAMQLLEWSLEELINPHESAWPAHLPRPSSVPVPWSDEHVATELCLVAAGYLLLHEVAHVTLRHSCDLDRISEEREADRWAVDWIFGSIDSTSPGFTKRALGIALALLLLVARGIHTGDHDGRTHPRHFDRLVNSLLPHVPQDREEVWGLIVAIMALHFSNVSCHEDAPKGPFDTFWSCVDAYVEYLANKHYI